LREKISGTTEEVRVHCERGGKIVFFFYISATTSVSHANTLFKKDFHIERSGRGRRLEACENGRPRTKNCRVKSKIHK
jgi:hypothetical protein